MARTPSMGIKEAENLLGPRGSLKVNADNKPIVKKWLSANGIKSLFSAGLSYFEMEMAYNKLDGSGLDKIRAKFQKAVDDGDLDNDAGDDEPRLPIAGNAPAPAVAPQGNGQAHTDASIQILRDLILQGYKPGLDEDAIRRIVNEQVAGVAPRIIEVRHAGKDAIKIEGLTHPEFERALNYLSHGANVMLVGPAGCGKSYLSAQLAKALAVDFGTISGSAGVSESELNGWLLPADGGRFEYCPAQFVELYEKGNSLFCFDEMDAFDPNMLLICNTALANGHMTVAKRRHAPSIKRGANVYLMGTANTFGTGANPLYASRSTLDEATRDRFIFITVDYDKRLEESIGTAGGLSVAEMAGIWELRDKTREAQLRRVISTRAFEKAAIMKQCGDGWRQIRDRLVEGWTQDEKAKVGA